MRLHCAARRVSSAFDGSWALVDVTRRWRKPDSNLAGAFPVQGLFVDAVAPPLVIFGPPSFAFFVGPPVLAFAHSVGARFADPADHFRLAASAAGAARRSARLCRRHRYRRGDPSLY